MTKVLRCSDLMHGCDYVARAESEDELMQKAASHAREKHGMQTVPPEVAQKIKSKIRTNKARRIASNIAKMLERTAPAVRREAEVDWGR